MDEQLIKLLHYLPMRIRESLSVFFERLGQDARYVSELRLRVDAPLSVTVFGRNVHRFSDELLILREDEVAETLQKLCEDSLHSYDETIREGYVTPGGFRIGVCGQAGVMDGRIRSIYHVGSLAIRIPHGMRGVADELLPYLLKSGRPQSALIYGLPNVGKTTLLRDLAATLSEGKRARRVAIVDTRGEIYLSSMFSKSIADVLTGYPRGKGIEIATRTLSPEIVICDEIGSQEEAEAILSAENCGVPLIATAHGDSVEGLLRRPGLKLLDEADIFRYYIGIQREGGASRFAFDIFDRRKAVAM